jgi:hypothetical protein
MDVLVLFGVLLCFVLGSLLLAKGAMWDEDRCEKMRARAHAEVEMPSQAEEVEQPILDPKVVGRRWWGRLLWRYVLRNETYEYRWSVGGDEFKLVIKKFFECDGASIPPLASFLTGIERDGPHRRAAFWHDVIYKYAGKLPVGVQFILINETWEVFEGDWTREQADRLFGRMLREQGVGKVDRDVMVSGVRWFGWWPWWKARRRMAKQARGATEARS